MDEPLLPFPPDLPPATTRHTPRPWMAWELGMLLPGAGHLCCGMRWMGVVVFSVFAASLAGVLWWSTGPHALLLQRMVLGTWMFSCLDAHASAQDMMAGAPHAILRRPRVAAWLNFSTGVGGFLYLGCFRIAAVMLALAGVLWQVLVRVPEGSQRLVLEVFIQVAFPVTAVMAHVLGGQAADIRWARRHFPQPVVLTPWAVVLVVWLGTSAASVFLVVVDSSAARYLQSAETIQEPQCLLFRNRQLGVEIRLPSHWRVEKRPRFPRAMSAHQPDTGCTVEIMVTADWPPVQDHGAQALFMSLAEKIPGFSVERWEHLGSTDRVAFDATTEDAEKPLEMEGISHRRGWSWITVLTHRPTKERAALCEEGFGLARVSFQFIPRAE